MKKQVKGWPRIGTLRKNKNNESYIKLNEGVDIYVDGQKVAMNEFRTIRLEDPSAKIDALQERGLIDEKEADKRRESLAEKSAWLKYELVVPPANTRKTE